MDVCNIDIWNLEGFKKYVVCIYLDANTGPNPDMKLGKQKKSEAL